MKKWREALKADFDAAKKNAKENQMTGMEMEEQADSDTAEDDEDDEDLRKLEDEIDMLKDEERRTERRAKKRDLKEKRKTAERINLKMIIPGDEGPTLQEEGLFKLSDIKSTKEIKAVTDQDPDTLDQDSDDDDASKKPKKQKYGKEKGRLDKSGLYYKDDSDDSESEEENTGDKSDDAEDLGLSGSDDDKLESDIEADEKIDRLNDPSKNKLIVDMEESNRESRKAKRASMWFDKEVFKGRASMGYL